MSNPSINPSTPNLSITTDGKMASPGSPEARPGGDLFKLSRELRDMIYEQMFLPDQVTVYAIDGSLHKSADAHYAAGDYTGILATCRILYAEAQPILYANTEFNIRVRDRLSMALWPEADAREICGVLYESSADWLDSPRSIVPVNQARVLTLTVETSTGARARSGTWTQDFIDTLHGISDLQKLHIALTASASMRLRQRATDIVLGTIAQTIKCKGTVTAEMDPSLGSNFDSASYYRMLAVFGGSDMTPTKFSERKHNLETRREDLILRIHEQNIFISGIYKRIAEVEEQADVSESSSDSLHKLHNDERSIRDTIDFLGMRVAQLDMSFELLTHQQAVLDNGRNRFLQEAEAAENSSA